MMCEVCVARVAALVAVLLFFPFGLVAVNAADEPALVSQPDLQETFDRAETLLQSGRVREALDQFGVVAKLAVDPLRSQALLKFGYAASILDRPESRRALTEASHTDVAEPEGGEIRSFARKLLDSGEKTELLTAPPKSSGRFFSGKKILSAVKIWDKIAAAEVFRKKGRVSLAIRDYRELIAQFPEHPVLLNNLALLLAEILEVDEADRLVRKAFNSPGAEQYVEYLHDTLGYVLLKRGQAVESIEHFRHALAMRETPERNLHMALAFETLGQPDTAEQYRQRANALDTTGQMAGAE